MERRRFLTARKKMAILAACGSLIAGFAGSGALLAGGELPRGQCRVAFLDIGQGDAILVESETGRQVLIDAGPNQNVLRELPKVMGAFDRTLDLVVATHPDADHVGGLSFVLSRYDVDAIASTDAKGPSPAFEAFIDGAREEPDVRRIEASRGTVIRLSASTTFEILYPDREVESLETNDASIVGKLSCGGKTYMLTGDAPAWVERYLVAKDGPRLKSDVLKAGHHGSNTSSAKEFIEAVDPSVAVISAGKDNRYGHPHKEVINTLIESGATVRSTMEEGAIVFE